LKPLLTTLIRNVFFSSVSFFIVGLIGLLIVPFIIKSYGVVAYGLIVFTRAFLPSGLLGIFDCGVMEVATKISARLGAVVDDKEEKEGLAALMALGLIVGFLLASLIVVLAPYLPSLLAGGDALQHDRVATLLIVTAVALLLLFPGLVIEGIVRGRENFLLVRATEIASSLFYACGVVLAIHFALAFEWVVYLFLMSAGLKVLVLGMWVVRQSLLSRSDFKKISFFELKKVFLRGLLFAQNKVLSTMQTQLPVMLIGFISGPVGSAVYDVVMRLPRFFKSVLGLTMSVVFPASARIDAGEDKNGLQKLLSAGMAMVMLLYYPLITACVVFSKKILEIWVGPDLASYWPWMALMFGALITNVLLSFVLTIGSVREVVQRQINRLMLYQAILQFAISFAFVEWQAERAFIIGQAIAMLIFFPMQMRNVMKNLDIKDAKLIGSMLRHACIVLLLIGLYIFVLPISETHSILGLLFLGSSWVFSYLILAYFLILDTQMRIYLKTLVIALRPRR